MILISCRKDFSDSRAFSERNTVLFAFGLPCLAIPDLVRRFKEGASLNEPDFGTLYTPGPKGYTDYPALRGS